MKLTKKELKKFLNNMGVPVMGNYIFKKDLKKLGYVKGEWDDESVIIDDLVKSFSEDEREQITESLDISDDIGSFKADGVEYSLIESAEKATELAVENMEQFFKDEPDSDWLAAYIYITDTDKRIIAGEEADDHIETISDDDLLDEADMTEEYEKADEGAEQESDKTQEEILEEAKEKVRDKMYEQILEELKDPHKYFVEDQGLYSSKELIKADFITVDYEKAAKDSVDADGWAHVLSTYNGSSEETENGMVYFRS